MFEKVRSVPAQGGMVGESYLKLTEIESNAGSMLLPSDDQMIILTYHETVIYDC
jgi:hypothetical protein